jgi:hypothetical protein
VFYWASTLCSLKEDKLDAWRIVGTYGDMSTRCREWQWTLGRMSGETHAVGLVLSGCAMSSASKRLS